MSRVTRLARAYNEFKDCHIKLASEVKDFEEAIREREDDCYYEILSIQHLVIIYQFI